VAIAYRVDVADPHAHLFRVTLRVPAPAPVQRLSLPVWIPGSYMVREFGRHLSRLQAQQGGRERAIEQLDKTTWQVACERGAPLVVTYDVYAFDTSVRTAFLGAERGFFNGTSLFLRVEGQEADVHRVQIGSLPRGWDVATAAAPAGERTWLAANYEELVDHPVELGLFWRGSFSACGVPHEFTVAGALPNFDGDRLLADAKRICETQIRFWHGRRKPPFERYVFLLNAVEDGFGGLEHRASTALIAARRELPRAGMSGTPDGYVTLLGLVSHEYFHTWNVKRLRPAEFAHYDYAQENYSQLLWFFEGFTSYYDDLLLRRAGLIDDATYLKLLTKTCNQVLQTPGRDVQSVAQASFDAWVKYYRQDENTANSTVSYYTKGALVALCFDLTLRLEGHSNLDAVMRTLWQRCKGGPMAEADFAGVLKELGGRPFHREVAAWVHGTRELPLKDLLERHGIAVMEEPAQLQQRLGVRVSETQGIVLKNVLRGGAAEQAGFAANDEWVGVEVAGTAWRMSKLDDLMLYAGSHRKLTALVARDRRLLRLELAIPAGVTTWRLVLRDAAAAQTWFGPQG
jgi:predicted metalloprotease with PDZ domain